MINRTISTKIKRFAEQYPVVTITGPRQSGKTTLCKALFPEYTYSNLESLEEREFATKDPKGYLARFTQGAVIDEIQNARTLDSSGHEYDNRDNLRGMWSLLSDGKIVPSHRNFTDSISYDLEELLRKHEEWIKKPKLSNFHDTSVLPNCQSPQILRLHRLI
jgi:hypothetical protein